jgi:hypothetical protein
MPMSDDDTQTLTIDGQVHTYMTNAFVNEAENVIAAFVEKGVPGKLRPGRSYIARIPTSQKTREKHAASKGKLSASAFATSGW